MKHHSKKHTYKQTCRSLALLILLSAVLTSCAGGPYGKMQLDNSVRTDFEQGKLLPAHQYYYVGKPGQPYAIIALDQDVELLSPFWRQGDFSRSELIAWSLAIARYYTPPPKGSWILDAQGNKIGAWYGSGPTPTVQSPAADQIKISVPAQPQLKS